MSFREIFKPWDIAVFLVIVLVTYLWSTSGADRGTEPEALRIVSAHGEDTLNLFTDTVFHRGAVVIEIADGRAAITASNCPSEFCVRTGWVGNPGQMSACMPNEIFIEVLGSETVLDVISY